MDEGLAGECKVNLIDFDNCFAGDCPESGEEEEERDEEQGEEEEKENHDSEICGDDGEKCEEVGTWSCFLGCFIWFFRIRNVQERFGAPGPIVRLAVPRIVAGGRRPG